MPLLGDVMATSRVGFERHGRGPSVREGAAFLRRPAPDANRPDPCNKLAQALNGRLDRPARNKRTVPLIGIGITGGLTATPRKILFRKLASAQVSIRISR